MEHHMVGKFTTWWESSPHGGTKYPCSYLHKSVHQPRPGIHDRRVSNNVLSYKLSKSYCPPLTSGNKDVFSPEIARMLCCLLHSKDVCEMFCCNIRNNNKPTNET